MITYTQFNMQHTQLCIITLDEKYETEWSPNKIYYMETVKFSGLLLTSKIKQNWTVFI